MQKKIVDLLSIILPPFYPPLSNLSVHMYLLVFLSGLNSHFFCNGHFFRKQREGSACFMTWYYMYCCINCINLWSMYYFNSGAYNRIFFACVSPTDFIVLLTCFLPVISQYFFYSFWQPLSFISKNKWK